jgi:hypothetical protein
VLIPIRASTSKSQVSTLCANFSETQHTQVYINYVKSIVEAYFVLSMDL